MDEFQWYSRLILWIGAGILLVEAVSGRADSVFTVLGTLFLAGGFAAFLVALGVSGARKQRGPGLSDVHGAESEEIES